MRLSTGNEKLLADGIDFFNAGDFFSAHDIWEKVWEDLKTPRHEPNPPESLFIQGLIQIAVGFYHLYTRKSLVGAGQMLTRGIAKMEKYETNTLGVDLSSLLPACSLCRQEIIAAQVANQSPDTFAPDFPPQIFYCPPNASAL